MIRNLKAEISPSPITSSTPSVKDHLAVRIRENRVKYAALKDELDILVRTCFENQEGFLDLSFNVQLSLILQVSEQMLLRLQQPEKWDTLIKTFCEVALSEVKGEK